jgi:pimeloyl-ACP methyl ester carboxylesterase
MVPLSAAESLSVESAGSGEPLVLIPGLFGSAFGFRTLVPLLNAAGYRTIVVEPLGIGSSARPEKANYSLAAQADRIAAVLDTLHVRDALIVGHSIGGAEALRLAYRRPDVVKGLVTIEGGPTEATMTPSFKRALRLAPWIKLFGGLKLVRRKVRGLLLASSGDARWVTEDVIDGYTAGASRNLDATLKAYLAMASARESERLASHLAEIRCPVRLLVGTARHDGNVPDREVSLLTQTLRSFALDSAPGAGHFVQEEQPATVVSSVDRLRASVTAARAKGSR